MLFFCLKKCQKVYSGKAYSCCLNKKNCPWLIFMKSFSGIKRLIKRKRGEKHDNKRFSKLWS